MDHPRSHRFLQPIVISCFYAQGFFTRYPLERAQLSELLAQHPLRDKVVLAETTTQQTL